MSLATYDQWKLRADIDEQLPEEEQRHFECRDCGGPDGSHDRRCPERELDEVDRQVDRAREDGP